MINIFKEKTSITLQEFNAIENTSSQYCWRLKCGRSVFLRNLVGDIGGCDDEGAIGKERRVAGMASEDDAAERRCLRPGTSVTRLTAADR